LRMESLLKGARGGENRRALERKSRPTTAALLLSSGYGGIAEIATCLPADVNDPVGLASLAESLAADLTIIGPEAPLVAGVAEAFHTRGLRVVGPTSAAARLEGSKIFAKEFTSRHSIPTARFIACDSPDSAGTAL